MSQGYSLRPDGAWIVAVPRLRWVIDSHTHLFLCEQPEGEVVAAAREAGVERMLNVGLDAETNVAAVAATEGQDSVFATVGCPPTEAAGFDDSRAEAIAQLATEN